MSQPLEDYRGGGDGGTLPGGNTIQLIPLERWVFLNATGGAGDGVIKLPNALGLQIGLTFRIQFTAASDQQVVINDYTTGTDLTIHDNDGVARTAIDFMTGKWGDDVAVEALLIDGTTSNGTWLIYNWSAG